MTYIKSTTMLRMCRFVTVLPRSIQCPCHVLHPCHDPRITACSECKLEDKCPYINYGGGQVCEAAATSANTSTASLAVKQSR